LFTKPYSIPSVVGVVLETLKILLISTFIRFFDVEPPAVSSSFGEFGLPPVFKWSS
jgi:hypothetical protein